MAVQPDCPLEDADPRGGGADPRGADGVAADGSLVAQGWTRRFLAAPERVAEALELYRSMGLEVRTEKPLPADFGERCAACAETGCRSYLMIYTRPQRRTP